MIQVRRRENGYDDRHYVRLRGLDASLDGQDLKISLGESVTCGRSRHCDWSLKRTPLYLKNENGEREALRQTLSWRATSRSHVRITYLSPDLVDVENLSENGTFVDGKRIDRVVLTDCRRAPHQIQLGPEGAVLELAPGSLPVD
jgi:pSer/pThr/pTyr-binding forkhead associated (FHA) protein